MSADLHDATFHNATTRFSSIRATGPHLSLPDIGEQRHSKRDAMKFLSSLLQFLTVAPSGGVTKNNIILDTDLFSDVE